MKDICQIIMESKNENRVNEPASAAYKATNTPLDLVLLTRRGMRKEALLNLAQRLGLTVKELANLLPVTERTIQRKAPESVLGTAVSEQIVLITQLTDKGEEVFGSTELFKKWIRKKNTALGGHKPLHLLDTSIGIQMVEDVLGRLSYGVYS